MKIKLHYPDPGMTVHGQNACKYHNFEKYDWKTDRDKPAVFWLYFDDDYKLLAQHKGPKYVMWLGTDVKFFAEKYCAKYLSVLWDESIKHVAMNRLLSDELFHVGIYAPVRPLFWGDINKYPKEMNFTKDCYMSTNPGRGLEYGEAKMHTLAMKYPDWNFHIFGTEPVSPSRVKYYGWIPEDEMDDITKNFGICLRLNMHDGFSQTVAKALMRGQEVITVIPHNDMTHYCRLTEDIYRVFDEWEACKIAGFFKNPIGEQFVNFDFINEYQPDNILS